MTLKPVIPRALANDDIDRAIDHYRAEGGADLALRFIDALERGYAHIARHPQSGSPRYAQELALPGLRCWPLKRFPYLLFYVEQPDRIDVWRALHAERDLPADLQNAEHP